MTSQRRDNRKRIGDFRYLNKSRISHRFQIDRRHFAAPVVKPEVALLGGGRHYLSPATLLQPLSLPFPFALFATQNVAADALIEEPEAVGEKVTDV